jgi:hypothetical protein
MRSVNGLEEARAALAAGERALASPPFAALHAGVGYYVALIAQLKTEYPDFTFTLCCGDDAAVAHEALRRGIRSVRCAVTPAMAAKLSALALESDAQFLEG